MSGVSFWYTGLMNKAYLNLAGNLHRRVLLTWLEAGIIVPSGNLGYPTSHWEVADGYVTTLKNAFMEGIVYA